MNNPSAWIARLAYGATAFAAGAILVTYVPIWAPNTAHFITTNDGPIEAVAVTLQTLIVLISVIVAYIAYRASIHVAARRTTLDRMFQEHHDRDILAHRATFLSIKQDKTDKLLNYSHSEKVIEYVEARARAKRIKLKNVKTSRIERWRSRFFFRRSAVFGVLNRYETFAIGIEKKAIDEEMYKSWWRNTLIRDWHELRGFIEEIRRDNPRLFIKFEALARRWEEETNNHKRVT